MAESVVSEPGSQRSGVNHVSWSNFRSFRRLDLDVARITILLGRNNSGKSSVHRPLVLLKQTMGIDHQWPGLYPRGPLVDCGSFQDCSYLQSKSPITFRLSLAEPVSISRRTDDLSFEVGEVELEFAEGPDLNPFQLRRFRVSDRGGRRLLERKLADNERYDYHGEICKGARSTSVIDVALRKAIGEQTPTHFSFDSTNLLYRSLDYLSEDEMQGTTEYRISQFSLKYMALTEAVNEWFTAWLGGLHYLGPNRAGPQRTYRLGSIYEPARSAGEEIPEILYRILQGETGFTNIGVDQFRHRLTHYLGLLKINGTIEPKAVGEDRFSLHVSEKAGMSVNIADSAFGISQVLPLVVRVLLSQPGDTIVVEQPEIHLNPAVQSALADVFVQGISQRSSVIIETHSEHFLNRLRTLVAEGVLPVEDLGIYFVDRGPKQSRLRPINVDVDGSLDSSWPSGFFGDALRQARQLNQAQRVRMQAMTA